jgi:1-aminocyclopropane-1-carboxylate deaminase/D-cysteine desulfhydrase-like pyridoxal-dependent ACC family enzyme
VEDQKVQKPPKPDFICTTPGTGSSHAGVKHETHYILFSCLGDNKMQHQVSNNKMEFKKKLISVSKCIRKKDEKFSSCNRN